MAGFERMISSWGGCVATEQRRLGQTHIFVIKQNDRCYVRLYVDIQITDRQNVDI
jgi:hypothetical protein